MSGNRTEDHGSAVVTMEIVICVYQGVRVKSEGGVVVLVNLGSPMLFDADNESLGGLLESLGVSLAQLVVFVHRQTLGFDAIKDILGK